MNALNKVEYIIVDWGSKEPLSNYFYDEISKCSAIKFINIPEKETKKSKLNFDHSKASDIGINSSLGEHVMLTGSDQFFPLSVFNNMLNILEKPETFGISGDEYKLVPRKFLQDDFFIYDENMEKVDQYFQKLSHSMLPLAPDFQMNDGSGAGGTILKKKQWSQIGGIKDTEQHNRGQDLVIFHETSEICSHIDTATFGFFLLKLPRSESGFRQTHIKKLKNPLNYLKFDKDESLINSKNIEIVSSLNLPQKKLNIEEQLSLKKEQDLTIKEIIKTTIECSIFTVFSKINLKSQDIFFILNMKSIIETNKLIAIAFQVVDNSSAVPDISIFTSGGRPSLCKGRITFSLTAEIASSKAILSAGLICSVIALSPSSIVPKAVAPMASIGCPLKVGLRMLFLFSAAALEDSVKELDHQSIT